MYRVTTELDFPTSLSSTMPKDDALSTWVRSRPRKRGDPGPGPVSQQRCRSYSSFNHPVLVMLTRYANDEQRCKLPPFFLRRFWQDERRDAEENAVIKMRELITIV